MKKYLLYLFLILLPGSYCFAQDSILEGTYQATEEELISKIDNLKKNIISELSRYNKVENSKGSSGSSNAYFDGKELKLVRTLYKEKALYQSVSWYFHRGMMVLGESYLTDASQSVMTPDEKIYLQNERIFYLKRGEKRVEKSSLEFKKASEAIGAQVLRLKSENHY
jgi:hypothetical protein